MGLSYSSVDGKDALQKLQRENYVLKFEARENKDKIKEIENVNRYLKIGLVVIPLVSVSIMGFYFTKYGKSSNAKEIKELANKYSVQMAELQRRITTKAADDKKFALTKFTRDLLPVCDSLNLALKASNGNDTASTPDNIETQYTNLKSGLNLIDSEFQSVLKKYDVLPIKTENCLFDPNIHEAKLQIPLSYVSESTNVENNNEEENSTTSTGAIKSGYVAEELRRGYMISGRVLRAAEVSVYK